jgi:hypothetical protein
VAVNVYVLISGYFGVEASGSGAETEKVLKRPFKIWKQVVFYSVVIGIIALITGIQQFDIYQIFGYIFPVVTEHYWFATAYIFLCLVMPFLNRGIESMSSKQLGYIIGAMLLFFSIAKTFIPMHLPWDFSGYDVLWFTALYLTGAYIRKYGTGVLSKGIRAVGIYLISTLVIFISFIVIRLIYLKTGKLEDFISYGYSYNYLFCYTGAIGMFVAFGKIKTGGLEKLRKIIELLSGATFGVYLIHEHINIRYLWPTWFATDKVASLSVPLFLISMLGTVIVVYMGCSLIEIIRVALSRFITKKVGKR